MELYSYTDALARDSALGADVLANAFLCDAAITHASPSLSVLSTPQLELLDTPDTVISHDFDSFSPQVNTFNTFGNFANVQSSIEDGYSGHGPFFGDTTLFPCDGDLTSSALLEQYEKTLEQSDNDSGAFVDTSVLSLSNGIQEAPGTCSSSSPPPSPASFCVPAPSFSRSSSNASFAVPKLPPGRKRKPIVNAGAQPVSKKVSKRSHKTIAVDYDEDEEKIALRAKNTEAAARSRARKRAAMESAELRIHELEQENARLKALISQKDVLLARYQD